MSDVLLSGGRLFDPERGRDELADLRLVRGRIAQIAPRIEPESSTQIIDVTGKLVVPGLIDLHTHVYPGAMPGAIQSDLAGVRAGITTVADAGSAGSSTFAGFVPVIRTASTRIVPFLNVARSGLSFQPELREREDIDVEATFAVIEEYSDLIRGLKVRAIGPSVQRSGLEIFERAREIAIHCGKPLMVHIGETSVRPDRTITSELLPLLRPGDILAHFTTGHPGGLLDERGKVIPEASAAYESGVFFDVGHGVRNLSFDVTRRLLDAGLFPHAISTDMAIRPRRGPSFSLVETMGKFLALGMTLGEVISRSSSIPARILGIDGQVGTLMVGRIADLSVLEIVDGRWSFTDSMGEHLVGSQAIVPVLTFRAGEMFAPDWGPHPWGWLPAEAI